MRSLAALLTICALLGPFCAWGLTSTNVLPEGISSPSFRFGYFDKVGERYTEDGTLMKLGDYKSVIFNAQELVKFNPEAKKLVDALNSFGASQLGDDFNLGVLRVRTEPVIKYFAPVFARGFTKKWTVGLGIPLVTYDNKVSIDQQFSNTEFYRQQFSGLSPELDQALNTNLATATHQTLQQKGYKPIEDRHESFVGDIQVASVYKLYENRNQAAIYQAQLSLPTGPKYNADDLAALNIFGRTSINNLFAYSHRFFGKLTAVPFISYLINIPDKITARVPKDENDSLPDDSAKEDVNRHIGNTVSLGQNTFFELNDSWTFGAGYEYAVKSQDEYTGQKNSRYDLLALNTNSQAHKVKAEASYSTVNSFFKKKALIPMILTVEISDVISGQNVERQLAQEMNVMVFF
ncbi:hypothetical protein ACES2L_14010 [Bdellovibrio bacteriovorus]